VFRGGQPAGQAAFRRDDELGDAVVAGEDQVDAVYAAFSQCLLGGGEQGAVQARHFYQPAAPVFFAVREVQRPDTGDGAGGGDVVGQGVPGQAGSLRQALYPGGAADESDGIQFRLPLRAAAEQPQGVDLGLAAVAAGNVYGVGVPLHLDFVDESAPGAGDGALRPPGVDVAVYRGGGRGAGNAGVASRHGRDAPVLSRQALQREAVQLEDAAGGIGQLDGFFFGDVQFIRVGQGQMVLRDADVRQAAHPYRRSVGAGRHQQRGQACAEDGGGCFSGAVAAGGVQVVTGTGQPPAFVWRAALLGHIEVTDFWLGAR